MGVRYAVHSAMHTSSRLVKSVIQFFDVSSSACNLIYLANLTEYDSGNVHWANLISEQYMKYMLYVLCCTYMNSHPG